MPPGNGWPHCIPCCKEEEGFLAGPSADKLDPGFVGHLLFFMNDLPPTFLVDAQVIRRLLT